MKILIVEDDASVRNALKKALEAECFAVDVAEDGEKGSFLARTNTYDMVILDYLLPKKNGRQICEEIRKAEKNMPVLLLSVQSEVEDKVTALNLGADDYLTKPFSYDELMARVRALLRRPAQLKSEVLTFDDLSLDIRGQKVTRGRQEVYLTRKEFMLLEYLLRNQGSVVSRAMLIDHVWDSSIDTFSNTIESHILSLRKKIEKPKRKIIQTVPGRGYKIDNHR
jgi:two-component system copper resistance phosphate regulon response regulator CusR